MSLRLVHIIFIVVATITMVGFGIWGIMRFLALGQTNDLLLGIGSIMVAILLIWYGIRFFKKLKDMKTMRPE